MARTNTRVTPEGYAHHVTFIAMRRQVARLDRLAVEIRARHGVVLSRSALIRALIIADQKHPRFLAEVGE